METHRKEQDWKESARHLLSFKGNYWIAGKILVVSTAKGGKSTQLGTMSPETLAGQLLLKLAKEGKA